MTREEIIKGLDKIGEFFQARADMAVGDGKMMLLNWMKCAEEAAEALKAQEPRVYTVDELKRGEHYYLELHLEPTGDGIHYAEISSIDRWHDKLHGKFKSYDLIYDERGASYMYEWSYGRTWRCWTSRPTDEQREAKPWNV